MHYRIPAKPFDPAPPPPTPRWHAPAVLAFVIALSLLVDYGLHHSAVRAVVITVFRLSIVGSAWFGAFLGSRLHDWQRRRAARAEFEQTARACGFRRVRRVSEGPRS